MVSRLNRLEKAVGAIVTRFGIDVDQENGLNLGPSHLAAGPLSERLDVDEGTNSGPLPPRPSRNSHSELPKTTGDSIAAPVFVIRDLATEIGVESPNALRSVQSTAHPYDSDLIEEGILSSSQASALLAM